MLSTFFKYGTFFKGLKPVLSQYTENLKYWAIGQANKTRNNSSQAKKYNPLKQYQVLVTNTIDRLPKIRFLSIFLTVVNFLS